MIQVLILFGEDEQCELMSKHAMLKPFSDISFQNMNKTSMKHVQQQHCLVQDSKYNYLKVSENLDFFVFVCFFSRPAV